MKPATGSDSLTPVERYYRLQSYIYDATRWSFLFGRDEPIARVAKLGAPRTILEVGCGTGRNLLRLAQAFPQARVAGVDISEEMLARAQRKIERRNPRVALWRRRYDHPLRPAQGFDLIVFSYCLSMINPGWEQALASAGADLAAGGRIAVVDFDASPSAAFKRWMGVNHVRMDGHLPPALHQQFEPLVSTSRAVYGGLWSYFVFVGEARATPAH